MENPYASRHWRPCNNIGRLTPNGLYRQEMVVGQVRKRRIMSPVALITAREAYEEGSAAQAEVVNGLVEAVEKVLTFRDMQEPTALTPTILRRAIAKATGI